MCVSDGFDGFVASSMRVIGQYKTESSWRSFVGWSREYKSQMTSALFKSGLWNDLTERLPNESLSEFMGINNELQNK